MHATPMGCFHQASIISMYFSTVDLQSRLAYMIFEVLYGVCFGTECFHALSGSTWLRNAGFYAFSRHFFRCSRSERTSLPGHFCVFAFLASTEKRPWAFKEGSGDLFVIWAFFAFNWSILFKVSRFWYLSIWMSLTLRVKYSTFRTKSTIRHDASFLLAILRASVHCLRGARRKFFSLSNDSGAAITILS